MTKTLCFQYNTGLMEILLDILHLITVIALGAVIVAFIIGCWYFAALLLSDTFFR